MTDFPNGVSSPAAPSYAAPLLDFTQIGQIPDAYYKGQQEQKKLASQNAFRNGIPKLPDGGNDYGAMTNKLLQLSDFDNASKIANIAFGQAALNGSSNNPESPDYHPAARPSGQPASPAAPRQTAVQPQDERPAVASNSGGFDQPTAPAAQSAPYQEPERVRRTLNQYDNPDNPDTETRLRNLGQLAKNPFYKDYAKLRAEYLLKDQERTPGQKEQASGTTQYAENVKVGGANRTETNEIKNLRPLVPGGKSAAQTAADIDVDKAVRTPTQAQKEAAGEGTTVSKLKVSQKESENAVIQSQKTYNGMQAQSSQYERDLRPYLTLSRSLLNQPAMYSGVGGHLALDINRVRAAFGDAKAAMLQEALQKVTASSVLGQINTQRDQLMEAGGTSSRIFSQQVDLVEKAAPALSTTIGGNRFLVEVSSRMGDLSTHVTGMAREYIAAHGHLDPGFDASVSKYLEAHPVFTEREITHPEILGAPTVPKPMSEAQTAQWARALGVRPGDPIKLSTGKVIPAPAVPGQ